MDIILRLHMYPKNMYSVSSLKIQKIQPPREIDINKRKRNNKTKQKENLLEIRDSQNLAKLGLGGQLIWSEGMGSRSL